MDLFYTLAKPIGFGGKGNKSEVAKEVMSMNLIGFFILYLRIGMAKVLFTLMKSFLKQSNGYSKRKLKWTPVI
jgi:hypothetical protein